MIKEECGLVGVFKNENSAEILYVGLFSLQHRGQESSGIIVSDGTSINAHMGSGLVSDVFTRDIIKSLKGNFGIGHVRYSTTGGSNKRNIQPFLVEYSGKPLAIAHNGNLTNSKTLRIELEKQGSIFQTSMDSEIIIHLLVRSNGSDVKEKLINTLRQLKGAFSLLIFTENSIIAARDANGFRPLCIGLLDNGYVIASETCAFDLIGAQYLRDVEPGEIVVFSDNGVESYTWAENVHRSHCIFEFIYFARPDSTIFTKSVYSTRHRLGENLAEESEFDGDIVVPIPDSGSIAALGFSQRKKIPFEFGIIRNHYIGRTFIQPLQKMRDAGVKIKLNPVKSVVSGKRVIAIEDSIVRGTTCRNRVKSLKDAGAEKVMLCVSCPPIISPCYYGIDFPSKQELIASTKNVEQIKEFLGLDGLCYLSVNGMLDAMPLPGEYFCTACFTGQYPVNPDFNFNKYQFEE